MRRLGLIGAAAGLMLAGIGAAQAAPGFSTGNVNMRAGPDVDFPVVDVIPEGEPVDIRGCLRDESWCDVIWAGNRGFVFSEYLAFEDRGRYVSLLDAGPAYYRIPFITFAARDYWRRNYVGRPWYRDRDRWWAFRPRPRVGWGGPPRGPRHPGWWRTGYRVDRGMRPPPDRWLGPVRGDRRFDGRGDRPGRRDDGPGRHRHRDHDGRGRH